jgi:hypothetical protein
VTNHVKYKSLKRPLTWREVVKQKIRNEEYYDLKGLLNILSYFLHRYGFSSSFYDISDVLKQLSLDQINDNPELVMNSNIIDT